jgi:hypothetical protein
MRFFMNIYGFDVWVSDFLKTDTDGTDIDGTADITNNVANLFFSASPEVMPIVGNLRQPPKVDSEYNKDLQREEFVTTARYAFKLYRPENMVCCFTATDQVS